MPTTPAFAGTRAVYDFEDAMRYLVVAPFLAGDHAAGRQFDLRDVPDAHDLVPLAPIERSAIENAVQRILARVDDCLVFIERYPSGSAEVVIGGPSDEAVAKVEASVRANAPAPPENDDVSVEFWCRAGEHPRKVTRRIDAPAWPDVARNYPAPVAAQLDSLMQRVRPAGHGRLVLWHGPPGTGKTTAARALARSWARWCRTLFVVDADELFGKGSYLAGLLLASEPPSDDDDTDTDTDTAGDDDGSPAERRGTWRLLIVEDADELLRADAKRSSGQAMARLLNLADGFLGQGLDILILLSTNEPVGRLHPAVVRPGRCLAEIEFRPFSRPEAAAWLRGAPTRPAAEFTLAELFEQRGDVDRIASAAADGPVGMYL